MKALGILLIICMVCGACSIGLAEIAKREAIISEVNGKVEIKTLASGWVPAKTGMVLTQGDIISTKADSSATLKLNGTEEATVNIKQNSQLGLAELMANDKEGIQKTMLDLALGEILIKTQKLRSKESKFEVKTPTSIVGVRGTVFSVAVESSE